MKSDLFCPAVKRIAWGYILLYFNINIGSLDLLPGWIGYLLFWSALPVLAEASPSASLLRPFALGLAAWNGVTWIFGNLWCPELLNVILGIVALYFHFQLLTELASLARVFSCPQERKLLNLRTVNTLLQTVLTLGNRLWLQWEGAAVILVIVNCVILVWICVALFGLKRSLEALSELS